MSILGEILIESQLLNEDVTQAITSAISLMKPAYIKYNSGGKEKATGRRLIYPVAYGLSKAGNPVVRAFEPSGDSLRGVPAWKFFRVDRIKWWRTVKDATKTFQNQELVGLNKTGKDKGMIEIFALSPLCGRLNKNNEPEIDMEPVTKGEIEQPEPKGKWNIRQIGRNIVDFFKNWKNKYQSKPEVSLDNKGNITYNKSEEREPAQSSIDVPVAEPLTKGDIKPVNKAQATPQNNEQNKVEEPTEGPITKDDIKPSEEKGKEDTEEGKEEEENPITQKFNEMYDRWGKLGW